jgi:O-antigen/teichoic acid export membrane protein
MGNLIAFVVFSGVGLWMTRSSYAFVFSSERLKELLHFGVPLVPLSLAHYVMTYSDRYFLRHFSGLNEVGLYAVGYRLASVVGLLVFGFQSAWGPFVYSTYKEKEAKEVFARTFDYASVVVCFAILVLSLFSREVLSVFTTADYVEAYAVIPFISASIAAYGFGACFGIGIGIAKKNIHRAWGGMLAAVLNLGLNYLLIPHSGMVGAAVASLVSFLLLDVILMIISQRYYHVEFRFGVNLLMYLTTAVFVFVGLRFFPSVLTWQALGTKVALLAVFVPVPIFLKLIGTKELRAIWSVIASGTGRTFK